LTAEFEVITDSCQWKDTVAIRRRDAVSFQAAIYLDAQGRTAEEFPPESLPVRTLQLGRRLSLQEAAFPFEHMI